MTVLTGYDEFAGRHWETGSVRNALAYQGVRSPHTGEPISEALLLGVSGGVAFGYFTFEYEGYLPHLALLTRNTFRPMETMLERLAIPQEVRGTDRAEKGEANLLAVLEGGQPALVWADLFSLPYNDVPYDERNWAVQPILVYGVKNGTVHIADRSSHPLTVATDVLTQARGRVKKNSFRVVTLDEPDWSRLPAAVNQGIWQCIRLFTEAPPKGKRDNFGLAALRHWETMLTNTRNKQSWARYFPPGERLWMALAGDTTQPGAYGYIRQGPCNHAERGMYADFLDEAALVLQKPALREVATLFRESEKGWSELAGTLLPDDVPLLSDAKRLLDRKQELFLELGSQALDEIREIHQQLRALQLQAAANFPLDDVAAAPFRETLAEQVRSVREREEQAVRALEDAMS